MANRARCLPRDGRLRIPGRPHAPETGQIEDVLGSRPDERTESFTFERSGEAIELVWIHASLLYLPR